MKIITFLILQLLSVALFSQKYGHVWQFGFAAGIDFNPCTPVALTNGLNGGFEGCSSVCDDVTGQLLFYTNSQYVWTGQNTMMQNGTLMGGLGTLSQVLIIKKPLSGSIYYIFTTMVQGGGYSFRYHTVDMSLNTGQGAVTSANNVIPTTTITEQVAATFHSNGSDIWVMVHEYGTNNFLAYLVTSVGITPAPVVSSIGPAHITGNSNVNARGEIKFSPNGLKVALNGNGIGTNNNTNILTLFDFNNVTGAVSNPIDLPYGRGDFGLSFSADNSKLYGTTWKAFSFFPNDKNYLYQFDLSSGNPTTIVNSKVNIDSLGGSNTNGYGSLKLGPDGKIYVARYYSGFLGVINSPNLASVACNYVINGFYLGGSTCRYGLNNYIEYTNYYAGPSPTVAATVMSPTICAGETAYLNASGATSYTWYPGSISLAVVPVSPLVSTSFTLTGSNVLGGCTSSAVVTQYVAPCTGLGGFAFPNYSLAKIFPNPGNGEFKISAGEDACLLVTDEIGQLIKTIDLSEKNDHQVLVSELENGIYFITGSVKGHPVKEKIVVVK